ncbi:hypothetical protein HOY82DRAFT_542681 [Tuber indicum]|nr:hypothetical protein HOY82DRAFT_542681 [Tuber indicum]
MSSAHITGTPSRPGLLSDSSQDVINQWFTYYGFSFSNPEYIAARLTELKRHHQSRRPRLAVPGNCDRILGIIAEVSLLPNHRHRRDAANIINQVNARLVRGTVETLVPDPARYEPIQGLASAPSANTPLPFVAGTLPAYRQPGAPIPDVSTRRIHRRYILSAPAPPAENDGLAYAALVRWIPESADFMTAMDNLRSLRVDDPGLHAPLVVDNPREVVMEFPEDIPLLAAPVPQIDPTLQRAARSPLTIYDTRAGPPNTRGALTMDHYIYYLIDLIRTKLLEPSVAAKYAIVNRAHPSRYRLGSTDNIADEPPASVNEVEGVMRWILHGFPMIEIVGSHYTQGGRVAIGDTYGFVPRMETQSHKVLLNSILFNSIEQAYREGIEYDALIFLLFATLAHEFGHYLNSCWHSVPRNDFFRTPRGLRYFVQLTVTEDPRHPGHHPNHRVMGEIGQLIEWLIFGFVVDIDVEVGSPAWVGKPLYITGWGSRPGNFLNINNYVCRRLMQTRPHLRMPVPELRIFTENIRREEQSGQTDSMDTEDDYREEIALGELPDVDAGRSGVSIPNTASGGAFRHAFVRLEHEIESARAMRKARVLDDHVNSCGVRMARLDSDANVRLHNNLTWHTNEIPPLSTTFLPFLLNLDSRIITIGYMFLCIASDYCLRIIWPTFDAVYSSSFIATIIVLGLFSR